MNRVEKNTNENHWTEKDRVFFLSFKKGLPEWNLFPIPVLKDLPAFKWKLENLNKLMRDNPKKHAELVSTLINLFYARHL